MLTQRPAPRGPLVVVVEQNLEVIKCADWTIDLGPEAAGDGGRVIACGTPEAVAEASESHTRLYLRRALRNRA